MTRGDPMGWDMLGRWSVVVYALVLLMTGGEIFGFWRVMIYHVRKWFTAYEVETCRMCQGVWVVVFLAVYNGWSIIDAGVVYGVSYFLATQER